MKRTAWNISFQLISGLDGHCILPENHRSKYIESHLDLELGNLLEHKSVPMCGISD